MNSIKYVKPIAVCLTLVLLCASPYLVRADEPDDPNAFHPGLLEEVEGREQYATQDGIEGAPYNPDPEDLMGAKERSRAECERGDRDYRGGHEQWYRRSRR
ncbi:MAG: hypothetical protein HQ549_01420 [Candidatus Omnitrophica bacterium]|nr:hypothetical protein [Candidatus Omnitrophota bacterium]